MKRLIGLLLSVFAILMMTTSVFAAGFTGGSRSVSSFGGWGFTSDTLATKLSYEALNTLAADINYGLQTGEIVFDNGMQAVTVTLWESWDAYVITGVSSGVTYVVVNGSGGRYYSPVETSDYTISAIAGSTYYLTDREPATSGSGYAGDYQISRENAQNISTALTNLGGQATYYSVVRSVDGETRYYISCMYPNRTIYYVCNNSGQLYYTVKEEADTGGSGDGSTFDDTEIISALNSVYDALDIGFYDVCNWLEAIQNNISSFNNDVLLMSQNMVNGFADLGVIGGRIESTLSTIVLDFDGFRSDFEYYFQGLAKSYGEEITVELKGEDNLLEWSSGDYIKDVQVTGDNMSRFYASRYDYENEVGSASNPYVSNTSDGYEYNFDRINGDYYLRIRCIVPDNADQVVHSNFVKNGDLRSPLNSNGKLVYSEKGKTLDGWTMWGDNGTLTIEDGYVNYSAESYDGYRNFYYPLDIDYELNATYTISFLARVNSCAGTVRIRAANGPNGLTGFTGHNILLPSSSGLTLFTTTFTNTTQLYDNARLEFNVNPNSSVDIDIYAVKVEKASSQSLAFVGYDSNWYLFTDTYTPPNPVVVINGEQFKLSTSLSFCRNDHDEIYYDVYEGKWMVYRYLGDSSSYLPLYDQKILNNTISGADVSVSSVLVRDLSASVLKQYLYDGINHVEIDGTAVVTVTYFHERTWFDAMHGTLDKLYTRLDGMDYREYLDEVEGKLTSLEATLTSQHDYLVNGLLQWGDMSLNALYGFSPILNNEYPDSYIKKIYDILDTAFQFITNHFASVESFQEELIAAFLELFLVDSPAAFDLVFHNIYFELNYIRAALFGFSNLDVPLAMPAKIYQAVDGLETTLSSIYDRLDDIEDAVVNADNVIIDITTDNDAFNIFYVTKTDGTTESVGETATDAAKVVGEFLSVFYRLIFADGLDNADIIHDFEEVYTVTDSGVNVW